MSNTVINNLSKNRYELSVDNSVAFITYEPYGKDIALLHTEVPEELQGQGIGKQLVLGVLNLIQESGNQVLPFCPFVFAYIQKNPSWKALVDPRFKFYDQL